MNIDNISYLVLYFVLVKGEMLKTEFECEYNSMRFYRTYNKREYPAVVAEQSKSPCFKFKQKQRLRSQVRIPPGQQANNSCQRTAVVVVAQVDDVWGIFNYLQSSLFTSNSWLLFTSHNTIAYIWTGTLEQRAPDSWWKYTMCAHPKAG